LPYIHYLWDCRDESHNYSTFLECWLLIIEWR
jgi:hypothetical protein